MQGQRPTRTCVGCGQSRPKNEFIRIIRTPEGEIRCDSTGKAAGRGAYLCDDPACLKRAEKRRALTRALRTEIPREIYAALELQMSGGGDHAE